MLIPNTESLILGQPCTPKVPPSLLAASMQVMKSPREIEASGLSRVSEVIGLRVFTGSR